MEGTAGQGVKGARLPKARRSVEPFASKGGEVGGRRTFEEGTLWGGRDRIS